MDRAEGPPRGATYFAPTTPLRWGPGDRADVPVTVTATRADGEVVVRGTIRLWVTPKKKSGKAKSGEKAR